MNRFLLLIIATCTFLGAQAFATIEFPEEVSALLQEPRYQKILNKQKREALQSGRTLHILSTAVVDLPPTKYVYLMLATSFSADVTHTKTHSGSIVGSAVSGPMGEVTFDGVYFKPAEEGPGGSSVGNQ